MAARLQANSAPQVQRYNRSNRKGGDIFFHKKIKFPRFASLANKSYIEITNTSSSQNTSGQRLVRKGGDVFLKHHPNERRPGQQQITSKKVLRQEKAKAGGGDVFLQEPHDSTTLQTSGANMPNTSQNKTSRRMHNTRHLEGCTKTTPRRTHTTRHLEGCTSKHLEGCTSQHLEGCTHKGNPKDPQ